MKVMPLALLVVKIVFVYKGVPLQQASYALHPNSSLLITVR